MGCGLKNLRRFGRRFWRGVREWCGDAAYERYLQSSAARREGCRQMSAQEFYVQQINHRYSRPNRCC
jgi:uncharacterized short protein YbdD (DUF466 family)